MFFTMKASVMDKTLIRNYALFVIILFLCVGSLGYALVSGERKIDNTDDWVLHSQEVIIESEELSKPTVSPPQIGVSVP